MDKKFFSPNLLWVECQIRVTPNARQNKIDKIENGQLKVKVSAIPEKGKANKAVIELLSKEWQVSKSSLDIIAGEKSRDKTIRLDGDPDELAKKLEDWVKSII